MQPLIGITTYGRIERPSPSDHYAEFYSVPVPYVSAVRRAGGMPVLLPPGALDSGVVRRLDGVVVSGGVDVEPNRYGTVRTSDVQAPDRERDEAEFTLTLEIVDLDLPALFICRGMQVLNTALGGTLHTHIPDLDIGDIHRDPTRSWATHDVHAIDGSLVASAMGVTDVNIYSGHHQALSVVSKRLEVTATAPDGIVEAVEVADRSWIVGVQWHPEVSAADDPTQQNLFGALVAAGARVKA